ncbi:MAG: hypothetical protein KGI50_08120, partial [Patescibacteria group bacterium]|nr:hypothetical protein [Patescibacteria group bacterium]
RTFAEINMKRREFLQLAHVLKNKHNVAGALMSEKLDGMRAFWDGGGSRGLAVRDVPWANVDKQDRFLCEQSSTGLWSRYGHPIFAPDWWLDKLPNFCLDGELYIGRKLFQQTMSTARTLPGNRIDDNWRQIKYMIFDTPPLTQVFKSGEIRDTNFHKIITEDMAYILKGVRAVSPRGFESQLIFLRQFLPQSENLILHKQEKLPLAEATARLRMYDYLKEVTAGEGEGVIIRDSNNFWEPIRSHQMLKVKTVEDAEAKVIGYTSGVIGLTGKVHGKIGALVVEAFGVKFELSGLTDEEREFGNADSKSWALANPGERAPTWVISKHFPLGSIVTFQYRELTNDGIPKEARYYRKHIT